jgi:hypothetical protein
MVVIELMQSDPRTNPFDVTKAVDFTDQQIAAYFVDMPGPGFAALANPRSPMPMLIRGGKGSGKTHLMRYFSYPLQKLRFGEHFTRGIKEEGYVGIYFRCGGLNAERFRNKGQSEDAWKATFAYYMELWFGQLVLSTMSDFIAAAGESHETERAAVKDCTLLFDEPDVVSNAETLLQLSDRLQHLQREMDIEINNSALTQRLQLRIRATSGRLVFGIPRVLERRFTSLRDILFVYLLDEYENLGVQQQRYVNTLLREKELPCSFKIGGRLYGFKTYKTYSDEEEIKEGSEYEVLPLDTRLRDNKQYQVFVERLCARRLVQAGYAPSTASEDSVIGLLGQAFETQESTPLFDQETKFVLDKYVERERPYFNKLRDRLKEGMISSAAPGVEHSEDLETLVRLLRCSKHPILEKLNIFRLYQGWRTSKDLKEDAAAIAKECVDFLSGNVAGEYSSTLEKRKGDLLAQLLRECDRKQTYLGFDTFIEMSEGLPRNLLVALKSIFNWAAFNEEHPFWGGKISAESQLKGVREAAEWFFDDARMPGNDGASIRAAVSRLATLFREVRFSDKPSEKAVCTFSADLSQSTTEAQRIVRLAENWSLLISVSGGQKDRNSMRVDEKFYINSILSPKWDLPVSRGGALELSPTDINSIFDPEHGREFDEMLKLRVARMNAPLFGARKGGNLADDSQGSLLPLGS